MDASRRGARKTDVVEFDQKDCIFLSHVLALQTSQTLKIMNSDTVGHNAKLDPKENSPFNQIIPGKQSIDYKFTSQEAAPFPVACSIHPWMNAAILVRDNGYFAVTADDGSFEIPNLPAGIELEFRVWQEKSKFISTTLPSTDRRRVGRREGLRSISIRPTPAKTHST